ncbi:hypothetical protein [Flavobacterium rhizosphaerae]|uniref:Vitamin K-dependent gamma-carboxylase n=1 Tax=Flavobacterium rhizosphaerae TaxID=3163298 RepID=A0ABW8YWW1_9FLAO
MIPYSETDSIKKQELVIKLTCFFWLIAKVMTYGSWLAYREIPTIGFLKVSDSVPANIHLFLFLLSSALLGAAILKPSKIILLAFLILETMSVSLDALRLQPWEYLYLFIVFFYLILKSRPKAFYIVLLFLAASTYFFSGLHKFSGAFLYNIWDNLLLRRAFGYSVKDIPILVHYSGLLLSMGELLGGILLLFLKNKRPAIIALMAMHIVILIVLGILLKAENYSILPWNLLMMYILIYIDKQSHTISNKNLFALPIPSSIIILLFWVILPVSNYFGFWASSLSSGMYTGKTAKIYICLKDTDKTEGLRKYYFEKEHKRICTDGKIMGLSSILLRQFSQPPFPALWYYERMYHRLKDKYPENNIRMYYTFYPYREITEIR